MYKMTIPDIDSVSMEAGVRSSRRTSRGICWLKLNEPQGSVTIGTKVVWAPYETALMQVASRRPVRVYDPYLSPIEAKMGISTTHRL